MLQGNKEMEEVDQKVLNLTFECANEIRALLLRYDLSNSAKYACLVKCAIEVAQRELPASRIADQFILLLIRFMVEFAYRSSRASRAMICLDSRRIDSQSCLDSRLCERTGNSWA
jgi:hypothetical protein